MSKEYSLVAAGLLFVGASTLDYAAGPISLSLPQPYAFFTPETLSVYPLTAVAIALRTLSIVVMMLFVLSLIKKLYATKAFILVVSGILTQLYAIQQLASGTRNTPIQWTLSFAYAGVLFILPVIYHAFMALIFALRRPENYKEQVDDHTSEEISSD